MPSGEFQSYFQQRASRFAAFYSSEPVARIIGRGPLFDRLLRAVDIAVALEAEKVLDVGCGSGPLFAPLAAHGIHVTGIDPAQAMVALAREQAGELSGLAEVQQRGWEQIDEIDAYDVAIALGVFDYVDKPADLLRRMGQAAPHVVGSFPSPGVRTGLRKIRYGARGVRVHGYPRSVFDHLAAESNMEVVAATALGRAGYVVHFRRHGAD
jgi:SAM-dependent methyltransferase